MTSIRSNLLGSKLPFYVDKEGSIVFTRALPPVLHKKQKEREDLLASNEQNDDSHLDSNITETQDAFHLSLDLPGVKKSDLTVQIVNGTLQVEGIRHYIGEDATHDKVYKKAFRLDASAIDASKLTANLSDGVLVISAPKAVEECIQTIPVTQHAHHILGGGGSEQGKVSSDEKKNETPEGEIHHDEKQKRPVAHLKTEPSAE